MKLLKDYQSNLQSKELKITHWPPKHSRWVGSMDCRFQLWVIGGRSLREDKKKNFQQLNEIQQWVLRRWSENKIEFHVLPSRVETNIPSRLIMVTGKRYNATLIYLLFRFHFKSYIESITNACCLQMALISETNLMFVDAIQTKKSV